MWRENAQAEENMSSDVDTDNDGVLLSRKPTLLTNLAAGYNAGWILARSESA